MSLLSLAAQILFVGHSLVGPDLPLLTEAGLGHMGQAATVEAQIINGAPLRVNWEQSASAEGVDARVVLARGTTDVLVLTEAVPLAAQVQWNDTAGQVKAFAGLAWEANPETRVYLYETWHSLKSGPQTVIEGDPGSGVPWRERIGADRAAWRDLASEASRGRPSGSPAIGVIPAGQAMGRLADEIEAGRVPGMTSIREAFSDDIHPNAKGLYLVAMVHLAAITGESPQGLPARLTRNWQSRDAVISDRLAAVMQRIAWETVQAQGVLQAAALPEAPAPSGIANPDLGFGLAGVHDWSVQQPFLDVMKTARVWTGHLPGRWGGMEYEALAAGGWLDAEGWPKAIPPGVDGLSTLILTDLPPDAGAVAGRYLLRHEGQGVLRVEGRAQNLRAAPGRVSFDFTPGEGGVVLTIAETDAADPIRRISVVREDRAGLLAGGALFNPDWLARLDGVRLVRFMDWMATNDSTLARLEDRPKPGDFTWARNGVPVEVMLALANDLGAEPWFTLPHLSEDALVRFYAQAVRDGLAPGLRAHVEFSNEVWNWQFAQARWAEEQGRRRWRQEQTWVQFYALRAAEVAGIWAEVFRDTPERLVRVIGTQTGWLGLEEMILDAPLVRAEGLPAPAESFDAYAVTGYFSALLGSEEKAGAVRGWLAESEAAAAEAARDQGLAGAGATSWIAAHRYDLAVERAARELRDGSLTGNAEDSLAALTGTTWPHQAEVARAHGLELVMYEGGTHVVGYGPTVDDAALTGFFQHLNYTPEMGALYLELMQGWRAVSAAPFNAFVDVYRPGKWGSWGALRHLTDDNPRWQALAKGCGGC